MTAMASEITGVSIVYLTICSGTDQRKTSKLRVTGLCEGNSPVTGEFPAQRASYAENVSIWWRHHDCTAQCANNDDSVLRGVYPHECLGGVPDQALQHNDAVIAEAVKAAGLGLSGFAAICTGLGYGTCISMLFASSVSGNVSSRFPSRLLTTATLRPDIVALSSRVKCLLASRPAVICLAYLLRMCRRFVPFQFLVRHQRHCAQSFQKDTWHTNNAEATLFG